MLEKYTRKIYHNCFARNKDGTRIEIDWDNGGKVHLWGRGADDQFWSTKIYNARVRNRKCKDNAQKRQMNNRKKSPAEIPLLKYIIKCK